MKNIRLTLATAIVMALSLPAMARFDLLEEAFEAIGFQASLNAQHEGWVTFRECEGNCSVYRLRFTAESKIFVDRAPAEHDALVIHTDKLTTILYEPQSKVITRMMIDTTPQE